jgi:hypothetical protein
MYVFYSEDNFAIFANICNLTASETWELTKRDRKQMNIFKKIVYRRILGPVYDNEKENWRILTNKEIYARVEKPTVTETIRLNRLCWFGYLQRM